MNDFFAANRDNRAAIAEALSALAGMRQEFTERGSADEHWFYDLTCEVVFLDFLLHDLLARIEGDKDAWSARLDARLLGIHTLRTIDRVGGMMTKTLEKRIAALTNNPAIVDPLGAVVREFATFRRLNDKVIRATRRELGMDEGGERPWALAEVDHQAVAGPGPGDGPLALGDSARPPPSTSSSAIRALHLRAAAGAARRPAGSAARRASTRGGPPPRRPRIPPPHPRAVAPGPRPGG